VKRLLFDLNCLLRQSVLYGTLGLTNQEIFFFSNLRNLSRTKTTRIMLSGFSKFVTKFLKLVQNKYLWNVTITEKCHLLPAVHFNFVQFFNTVCTLRCHVHS
jgi:hypothetical protein